MKQSDRIRLYAKERYFAVARKRGHRRVSILVGDVVRSLKMAGRTPAVCSALKTRAFLKDNGVRLVDTIAPRSGQSTTVVYTYEFESSEPISKVGQDPWLRLRGALKDVFAELGGGEAYLRAERRNFYPPEDGK